MAIGGSTIEEELEKLSPPENPAPAISVEERYERIEKARKLMGDANVQAIIIGAGASLNYFTGVTWGASERFVGMLLPKNGKPIIFCPFFELGSLQSELQIEAEIILWQEEEPPFKLVSDKIHQLNISRLAIDPSISFEFYTKLGQFANCDAVYGAPIINGCRMYKSPAEIAIMQQAKNMTLKVHKATARIMHEGITNFEVMDFIDKAHNKMGSSGTSFCIVQFGKASSYPHGVPGVQYLKENEVVLVDTGCYVKGYTSDITRTYVYGKATQKNLDIWNIEKEAQYTAYDAAKLGETCESVDYAVRALLEKYNLGPDYKLPGLPHRTGHGIGLSIHEPAFLVRGDKTPLGVGMCFSNEPMIVVPDEFGIRLEDHIYMTEEGVKWFTQPQPDIYEV